MWFRAAALLALFVAVAEIGSAEQSKVFVRAVPPEKGALDRLNLSMEWSLYLPVEGRRDAIEMVQTFDDQLFVQTRTGRLFAIDARTGKIQWQAALGNGGYSNIYGVAVNSKYVFVSHVTKLYSFYRYSGVVEFVTDLGTTPTADLTADNYSIYATLATRPGAAGVERIAAYDIPNPIAIPDPAGVAAKKPSDKDPKTVNPVDELANRYPVSGVSRVKANDPISDHSRASFRDVPLGGMAGSKTPSLAVATRVTPPYFREGTPPVASLVVLPSLQPPYHLRDQSSRDIQKTPSISTIPPSVASALALSDLRAHGIEPKLRWEYGMTRAVSFRLTQTPMRVWAVTDDRGLVALSKVDKTLEVAGKTFEQVAAAPGQAGTMGYAPLGDGTLIAVDLATGNRAGGLNVLWQANVGGLMNHTPIVTDDAVFSGGDNSGVARVDRKSGLVYWRTPNAADRVVAVNQDFLYIQDRVGKLQVFDVRRANGSVLGRTSPLASMDMSAFNVPIANTVSDRLFFASNNGLIVCLRDASPKYATMIRMAPPIDVNPQVKAGVEGLNKAPEAKKEEEPKKEEAKKE